jgi:transposase
VLAAHGKRSLAIKTNMAPLRGWGPKGKRPRAYAPHGHWRTLTFIGAPRLDRLTAPCVFDGPINGECFLAYARQQLAPVPEPGGLAIMDNLGSHKSKAVRQAIQKAGAKRPFLPSYSPDLNPIEQAFAKIKHWMRGAQKRSIEDACDYIGSLVQTITPAQCKNYFQNNGYASVKI